MFALIDCNNFFVSCERLFRPDLDGMPVVVLSSNDGCAVSRSNEAKSLGVAMGEPLHQIKQKFRVIEGPKFKTQPNQDVIVAFSGNFPLYADISRRVFSALAHISPVLEIYSIDEAFLDISNLNITDCEAWGTTLAKKIKKEIGIPVSVGIAPTKTLCKIATQIAKKQPNKQSSCALIEKTVVHQTLTMTPIESIWGIGRRLAPKLKAYGLHSALDVTQARPQLLQRLAGISARRVAAELSGAICYPVAHQRPIPAQVSRGRQFGRDVQDIDVIESAIARLASRACQSLRTDKLCAETAVLTLQTNHKKIPFKQIQRLIRLPFPTANAGLITSSIMKNLTPAFDSQTPWHRAEVTLLGISVSYIKNISIFQSEHLGHIDKEPQLLGAIDHITATFGQKSIGYASEALSSDWRPRSTMKSPNYTSEWSDLPRILAR